MITMEMVRNARLEDLFFATISKELTWEEAEKYHLSGLEGIPDGITPSELLRIAIAEALEEAGEITEGAVEEKINEIKNSILSCIKEEQVTIIFIKNNEYFDVTSMEIFSDEYNISNLEPLSKYATENDFELEESEEGLVFSLEENILEKYLKEIEK